MSLQATGVCWNCSEKLTALEFHRADTCLKCGKDTRVCKNCIFYDTSYNNQCKENQADRVVEKEKANFCDYFKPSDREGGHAIERDKLKSAAESLFKKSVKNS